MNGNGGHVLSIASFDEGVRKGDKSACGGMLVTKGGVVKALFSGPVVDYGSAPIDLFAVKVVLETFKKAGWALSSALTIELDNKILINWLENTLHRPWGIAKYIAEIDSLVCGCVNVHFKYAEQSNMAMVGSLAFDGRYNFSAVVDVWYAILWVHSTVR
ncbi:hypothetical protein V6N13_129058 [Hibiscus sabdariffa]